MNNYDGLSDEEIWKRCKNNCEMNRQRKMTPRMKRMLTDMYMPDPQDPYAIWDATQVTTYHAQP